MPQYFIEKNGKQIFATEEQVLISDAVRNTSDNIMIAALAGAAKTTTLEFICKYKTGLPTLSLAFNKKIADEMSERLPGHVKCQTLNSLGHQVWAKSLGKKVSLDFNKIHTLTKEYIDALPKLDKFEAYEMMGTSMKGINMARAQGYIPEGKFVGAQSLVSSDEFFAFFEYNETNETTSPLVKEIINEVLIRSIKSAYNGSIDFADQLYMPTLFGGTFPAFPLVLVDEAQDLSPLNHAMLRKLARTRLIAVGDSNQSIYGFRGAVSNGMEELRSAFDMKVFDLSVSFRCPKSVIRKAWSRAPHMRWPEWAIEGEVQYWGEWNAASIEPDTAIICRNNAPLFSLALTLIRNGKGCKLVGADIGPQLVKTLKKLGASNVPQEQVLALIDAWEKEALRKAKNPGAIEDKAECLRVFAHAGETLGAAVAYAEHLFASSGSIQLMSGHKSKGLEFDTVIHLDPFRVPSRYAVTPEAQEQELNVRYVIETRPKKTLILANLEDFQETL